MGLLECGDLSCYYTHLGSFVGLLARYNAGECLRDPLATARGSASLPQRGGARFRTAGHSERVCHSTLTACLREVLGRVQCLLDQDACNNQDKSPHSKSFQKLFIFVNFVRIKRTWLAFWRER